MLSETRFIGSMVGCGIGDSLGARFEGSGITDVNLDEIRFDGVWTDDTHMMIGVAESLIACRGFDGEHMVRTFMRNWDEEPWRGYGSGPPRIFRMIKSGVPWQEAASHLFGGQGSFGNGAAMRVAPVGLLYYDDLERLREVAYGSAETTHVHDLGKEGAALQAYAVALALQMGSNTFDPELFLEKIIHFTKNEWYIEKLEKAASLLDEENRRKIVEILGNGIEAVNSVPTAIYCFTKNHKDYNRAVKYAVSLGGDTDTIGAMTGAIAGAHQGQEGIAGNWRQKLEKSGYIIRLAKDLWKLKLEI